MYSYFYIVYSCCYVYTGWSKNICASDDYSTKTIPTKLMIWRWPTQNTFGMWTVLCWTPSSRTQFGVSINVWRLAGDTLKITCNFLYCNHQVHRDCFFITLYILIVMYLPFWYSVSLCRSVYCLCVNVYCTTATQCQPNCSQQIHHIITK